LTEHRVWLLESNEEKICIHPTAYCSQGVVDSDNGLGPDLLGTPVAQR